jgi:hypothetical protein
MPCPSVVRVAGPNDFQECFRLFMQADKDNGGLFLLAPDKVQAIIHRFLNLHLIPDDDTGMRGIIGVIGEPGSLEALCGLVISDIWYTHQKHLADFLVFVDPEARHSEHAQALLAWMKKQSDLTGLPLMSGIVSTKRTEAKCRLYKRMMPKKVGEYYFYAPATSDPQNQTTH